MKTKWSIDINCDLGEGLDNEAQLMPYISSCNIACGGHAGNDSSMQKVIELAQKHQVKIGAHPSYPDPENFGRQPMDISAEALLQSLIKQINRLLQLLAKNNGHLHHIKAHGALYNEGAKNPEIAQIIINAVLRTAPKVFLYVPYASVIAKMAQEQGIAIQYEVFADRNYNDDLSLVSRSHPKAILKSNAAIEAHICQMICEEKVSSLSGEVKTIVADTCCVHGDHPEAIDTVKHIFESLPKKGICIE